MGRGQAAGGGLHANTREWRDTCPQGKVEATAVRPSKGDEPITGVEGGRIRGEGWVQTRSQCG